MKDKLQLDDTVGFLWDTAHVLQLADKDTRKSNEFGGWIDDIAADIAAVLCKFSFGKLFEAAIEKAHDLGIDLKAPQWFSDTRFAAYAYTVFNNLNFMMNYKVVRSVLEDVAASNDKRAKEADDLLRRIRKVDFVAKALILVDYYRHLGKVSQALQRVDYPIWLKAQALRDYIKSLENMKLWDDHDNDETGCHATFCSYETDLQKCKYEGLPLLTSDVGLMIPLRRTRQQANQEVVDDDNELYDRDAIPSEDRPTVNQAAVNKVDAVKQGLRPSRHYAA